MDEVAVAICEGRIDQRHAAILLLHRDPRGRPAPGRPGWGPTGGRDGG